MPVVDWSLAISIGGTDRTADCLGAVEWDRELDAAAVASFACVGTMPAVGAAVLISGDSTEGYRGVVDHVAYDPDLRAWRVTCTDDLQGLFEAQTSPADVLELLPEEARWHTAVFGSFSDGWECAEQALSTIPYSIFRDPANGQLAAVSWAGSGSTTTIAHTTGGIFDGSVSLSITSNRERVAEIIGVVDVRYQRLHHWRVEWGWGVSGWSFEEYLSAPYSLPTRDMIAQAASSNTFAISESPGLVSANGPTELGIYTTGLPESGVYGGISWTLGVGDSRCIGAQWAGHLRWAQTVTETYVLRVIGTDAEGVIETDAAGWEQTADDTGWESGRATSRPQFGTGWIASNSYETGDLIQGGDRAYLCTVAGTSGTTEPAWPGADGTVVDGTVTWTDAGLAWQGSSIHRYLDVLTESERVAVIECMLGVLATRIRRSQRGTVVGVGVVPGNEPPLGSRCAVIAEDLSTVGQVAQIQARYDWDTGDAEVRVSVIATEGGAASDALAAPVRPDTSPGGSYTGAITLPTFIGGRVDSLPQNNDWSGWVGNLEVPEFGASETYQEGFVIDTPDVPSAGRSDLAGLVQATYAIDPLLGTVTVQQP